MLHCINNNIGGERWSKNWVSVCGSESRIVLSSIDDVKHKIDKAIGAPTKVILCKVETNTGREQVLHLTRVYLVELIVQTEKSIHGVVGTI